MFLQPGKKIIYALGQFGLVLVSYGILKYFTSFYVSQPGSPYPVYIFQGYIGGLFTAAGLVVALGRLFDAGAGLVLGWLSDKRLVTKGNRSGFMVGAFIPLAFFSVLVFFPPTKTSYILNTVSVLVVSVLFFFFLSLYTAPYLALLSELGKDRKDRLQLSTLMACATAFASLAGNYSFTLIDEIIHITGFSRITVFRLILVVFALVSTICLALPAFLLHDHKPDDIEPIQGSFSDSLRVLQKDSYLRHYLIADLMYQIAVAFTITGLSWYITVLLGLPKSLVSIYLLLIFFANLILFVPVCFLAQKIGKRKMLFSAFIMLMLFLIAASFAGRYPFTSHSQGIILCILVSIPIAIFTVVPNALIADLSVANKRKTGQQRGGLYFGMYAIVSKAGQLIAAVLFPLIVSIGAKPALGTFKPAITGLRLTLILGAVLSFTGFLFLFGYREKEVSALLEKDV